MLSIAMKRALFITVIGLGAALMVTNSPLRAQAQPIEYEEPSENKEKTTPAAKPLTETQPATQPIQDTKVDPLTPAELTPDELAKQQESEAAARAAKLEAARLAEARRLEAERTWFDKLLLNSKLYTGLNAGAVVPLNALHSAGLGLGMTIDWIAYQRYGFHFGAETGSLAAKAATLISGSTTITVSDKGTFGYLNLRFAGMYAFPKIFDLETAAGLGVSIYQLNSGTYSFNTSVAPVALGTAYYSVLPSLQIGLIAQIVLPRAWRISSASTEYALDSSQSVATASLHASVRYMWF